MVSTLIPISRGNNAWVNRVELLLVTIRFLSLGVNSLLTSLVTGLNRPG